MAAIIVVITTRDSGLTVRDAYFRQILHFGLDRCGCFVKPGEIDGAIGHSLLESPALEPQVLEIGDKLFLVRGKLLISVGEEAGSLINNQ